MSQRHEIFGEIENATIYYSIGAEYNAFSLILWDYDYRLLDLAHQIH